MVAPVTLWIHRYFSTLSRMWAMTRMASSRSSRPRNSLIALRSNAYAVTPAETPDRPAPARRSRRIPAGPGRRNRDTASDRVGRRSLPTDLRRAHADAPGEPGHQGVELGTVVGELADEHRRVVGDDSRRRSVNRHPRGDDRDHDQPTLRAAGTARAGGSSCPSPSTITAMNRASSSGVMIAPIQNSAAPVRMTAITTRALRAVAEDNIKLMSTSLRVVQGCAPEGSAPSTKVIPKRWRGRRVRVHGGGRDDDPPANHRCIENHGRRRACCAARA